MSGKSNLQFPFPLSKLKALLTQTDFEGQADKSFVTTDFHGEVKDFLDKRQRLS